MALKTESEMLQLELYVYDVDETASLFTSVFDMIVIEEKQGWRHLRHSANYDIMLFSPVTNIEGESHWQQPEPGTGGAGIEIVVCTSAVVQKRKAVCDLGYECTDLRFPSWGSIEFMFHLKEGYLLRIKQPPGLDE